MDPVLSEDLATTLLRAYLAQIVSDPRAEFSGIYMGIPFTKHADGTFSMGPASITPNVVYEKASNARP